MLGLLRDWLETAPARRLTALGVAAALASACGPSASAPPAHVIAAGGPTSRIEERSLADRPPLSIIEREGDPETAIALSSLASGSAALHATWGEVLAQRLKRAGYETQLVAHGLGFELVLLAATPDRARTAVASLLQALTQPVSESELPGAGKVVPEAAPSAVAACSAELDSRGRVGDLSEIERERIASFARDRSAFGCVGTVRATAAVADALAAGPDWPELGRVRSTLPERSATQVDKAERPTLSVAFSVADPNRALGAASTLGAVKQALGMRLAALGSGLRLRRVVATAHPLGACLRIDSDVDASPLPDARRLGFAIALMQEEARRALASSRDAQRLENTAISAADPRIAARAAAYRALTAPAPNALDAELVALSTPEGALSPAALDAATEQARSSSAELELKARVEAGQPGVWALVATPCASATERADSAGHSAVLLSAASLSATRGARLEPWVGASGAGLLGFVERAPGETDAEAAARLGDALGHALLAPPSAADVAAARSELVKAAGAEPRPLLDGLLENLASGRTGALAPRGSVTSLLAASREAVLARQRELLRLPHRVAVLSPSTADDAAFVTKSLARWLKTPDAARPSPCEGEAPPPTRSSVALVGSDRSEGSYIAFRVPAKHAAEAAVIVDLLNQAGSPLARALSEPDLVGVARALLVGTSSARALLIHVSAFDGREAEATARVQKLLERVASGGALSSAEVETALARQRAAHRLASLDPRYRLVQLLEPSQGPADAAVLRRVLGSLRPELSVVAGAAPGGQPATSGKTPASR